MQTSIFILSELNVHFGRANVVKNEIHHEAVSALFASRFA